MSAIFKIFRVTSFMMMFVFFKSMSLYSQDCNTGKCLKVSSASDIISNINNATIDTLMIKEGTYNFTAPIEITRSDLLIISDNEDRSKTVLKLTAESNGFIKAYGENVEMKNLTINGGNNLKTFGNALFEFTPTLIKTGTKVTGVSKVSKKHKFDNVVFKKSNHNGISAPAGFAIHGLFAKNCAFNEITHICVYFIDRNTAKRFKVLDKIDKVIVNRCTFGAGYDRAVVADCGNDRKKVGDEKVLFNDIMTHTGTRITTTTSLSGSEVKNCTFYKAKRFHIGCVQASDYNVRNNIFYGMTGEAGYGESIHFEQFVRNIEITGNQFHMNPTGDSKYKYISIAGTEGHRRYKQTKSASADYATWLYYIDGGSARRADPCVKNADSNKECKRDVHAYGSRKIYIADNTFNASDNLSAFITLDEAEQVFIGAKRDGTNLDNTFVGNVINNHDNKKIWLEGYDEGTCNVWLKKGQGVGASQIYEAHEDKDVYTSLCRKIPGNHNRRSANSIPMSAFAKVSPRAQKNDRTIRFTNGNSSSKVEVYPNPVHNVINIESPSKVFTVTITNSLGKTLKTYKNKGQEQASIDVSNLATGLYLFTLESDNGEKVVKRLVKN